MAAFIVGEVEVHDQTIYDEYRKAIPAILEKFGGKFVVRGGKIKLLEGETLPKRMVILEFESMEKLETWYNSPEYAPLIEMRQRCATSRLISVEGFSPTS